jgi:hypothetical protein
MSLLNSEGTEATETKLFCCLGSVSSVASELITSVASVPSELIPAP